MYETTYPKVPPWKVISGRSRKVFHVLEKEAKATRSQETSQLSLLEQLKPAWLAMKAFGLLPISAQPAARTASLLPIFSTRPNTASGTTRIAIFSLKTAYAAAVYLVFALLACMRLLESYAWIISDIPMPQLIFSLMFALYAFPHLLIGPLHWANMGQVLGFFNKWDKFQTEFLKVTRHPLRLNMRRLTTVVIVLVLTGSTAAALALNVYRLAKGEYRETAFALYSFLQTNLLLAVWVLLCLASSRAANQLATRLRKEFKNGESVGEHVVPGYRQVWLRLSQLTCDIGTMFSSVFNVMVVLWLGEMLLSAFQAATLVANSCSPGRLVAVAIFAFVSLGSILIFCYAASLATDALRGKFMESLVELAIEENAKRKQIQEFELAVSVHDAVINLGGYYDVNKALVVSIMSAFATFLVVLFQSTSASDLNVCDGWALAQNDSAA